MALSKRQIQALMLVGVLLGAGAVAASHWSGSGDYSGQGYVGASANGPEVALPANGGVWNDDAARVSDTELRIETRDAGNATFISNGHTSAQADTLVGEWTNLSSLALNGNELTVDPDDKRGISVSGSPDTLDFRDATVDDGNVDFVYSGSSGTTSVTVRGLPANTEIGAADVTNGGLLATATTDGIGTATFSGMDNSRHAVALRTSAGGPSVSNAQPDGKVSERPDELRVDVSDPDFPNDEVDVTINFEGEQVHSETVTSDTTVSTTNFDVPELGTYSWSVEVTDGYGNTVSESYTFDTPSSLTFRNETNASQLVTGADTEITLYSVDGTTTITRTDENNDGEINLTSLDNTEFVVTVTTDDYYERRVYLESIYQQTDIFLLNQTAYPEAVFTEFQLDDRTGNFVPGETTLRVQRAIDINGDNESEWQTIAGDFFGATNRFPFTGEYQTRYRLVVENRAGDRRTLGTYTPTIGGTQTIPIGAVSFSGELANGTAFRASVQEEGGHRFLHVKYLDTGDATESLTYNVTRADNESIEILANVTETDIEEEYLGVYNLSQRDPAGATGDVGYRINYWAERSGNNTSGHVLAGAVRNLDFGLDDRVRTLAAWVFLVAIAGVTALFNWKLSMLTTPTVATGFAMTGILPIPGVLIALSFVIAGMFWMGEGRYS